MLGEYLLLCALSNDHPVIKWIGMALLLVEVVGKWSVLNKADRPGWSQFIPIYGDLVLLDVAEMPWWWILGLCIPFVDYAVRILIGLCIARNFERGIPFGLGLAFLPFIFYPIMGFNGDEWGGPGGNQVGI